MAGIFSVGGGRADVDTRATVYVLNAVDRKLKLGTCDLYLLSGMYDATLLFVNSPLSVPAFFFRCVVKSMVM